MSHCPAFINPLFLPSQIFLFPAKKLNPLSLFPISPGLFDFSTYPK